MFRREHTIGSGIDLRSTTTATNPILCPMGLELGALSIVRGILHQEDTQLS